MSLSPDQKLAAYFLGRRIAGQRRKQDRVPVAYLYNGVRLPGLPPRDAKYRYGYISNGFAGIGRCYVYAETITYGVNENGYYSVIVPAGAGVTGLYTNGQWETPTVIAEDKSITVPNGSWLWANFDVLNEDGTVYLAASDPIPVYE